MVKIDEYFPNFLSEAIVTGDSFKVLSESVDRYGSLNDLFMIEQNLIQDLNGASLANAKILIAQLEEVKTEADAAWLALKIWQENSKVFYHIDNLKRNF